MTADAAPYRELLDKARRIVREAPDRDAALLAVCELLRDGVEHYGWVGFYLADSASRTLTLGPYVGEPTEHVRIAFGQGICGQAAERRETFLVQDVSTEANYLSCSPTVRSEIVVPVTAGGEIVAELDIDSHTLSAFTDEDVEMLEAVAEAVGELF